MVQNDTFVSHFRQQRLSVGSTLQARLYELLILTFNLCFSSVAGVYLPRGLMGVRVAHRLASDDVR